MMAMRKITIYLLLLILIPFSVNAQKAQVNTPATDIKKSIDYASAFGISYGIDDNINAYKLSSNSEGNNFYKGDTHYNIGLSFGWMISKRFRPRIEFKYTKLSYHVGWADSNIPSIYESIVNMYNLGINLRADYVLLNVKKFQMFVSPAVKWEFGVNAEEHNLMNDGTDNWGSYNGVIEENPRNLVGGSVAAIFKYNIVKKIGITLTPEYTYFLRNFVLANDNSYNRLSINIGVEYNFF
jgi:hypothetical protein